MTCDPIGFSADDRIIAAPCGERHKMDTSDEKRSIAARPTASGSGGSPRHPDQAPNPSRDRSRQAAPRRRTRSVLLEHHLPDGSAHIDWLVAFSSPPSPGARCVWTARLDRRPDQLDRGDAVTALRLDDHRALYLHHEGRVTPDSPEDRGHVRRLAIGSVVSESRSQSSTILLIDWRDRCGDGPISTMRFRIASEPEGASRELVVTRLDGRLDRPRAEIPRRCS